MLKFEFKKKRKNDYQPYQPLGISQSSRLNHLHTLIWESYQTCRRAEMEAKKKAEVDAEKAKRALEEDDESVDCVKEEADETKWIGFGFVQ